MSIADNAVAPVGLQGYALKRGWWPALEKLRAPPLNPHVTLEHLNRAFAIATWIWSDWAGELEAEGWQPVHMFRPPTEAHDPARGLCWRWFDTVDIVHVRHRVLVTRMHGGIYFAYEARRDGSAPLLTGDKRRKILDRLGYPTSSPARRLPDVEPDRVRMYDDEAEPAEVGSWGYHGPCIGEGDE